MALEFSNHALQQLRERNLRMGDVEKVVQRPLKTSWQSSNRYRAIGFLKKQGRKYLLVVIYDAINSKKEVVTAFITTKIKKYL